MRSTDLTQGQVELGESSAATWEGPDYTYYTPDHVIKIILKRKRKRTKTQYRFVLQPTNPIPTYCFLFIL